MSEETFNAAKGVYTAFGMFFQQVVNEYGLEKTMELHRRTFDLMGQGFASMITEQFGDELDIETVGSLFKAGNEAEGLGTEQVLESPYKVVHTNPSCPRYEGFKEAGMSDEFVEEYCKTCEQAMTPHFKNIGLKYEISDFSAPDGKCVETISKIQ